MVDFDLVVVHTTEQCVRTQNRSGTARKKSIRYSLRSSDIRVCARKIGTALFYNPAVLRLSPTRSALLSVIIGATCASVASQITAPAPAPENNPKWNDPALVSCGDKPPFSSRTVRGDTLIAPDGKHRAYAEVEANALYPQPPAGRTGPTCVNNSRIFVAGETPDYKIRFLEEPSDVESGNSLRLVDWSSDGRRLLAELGEWQYDQPGVTHNVVIYDARNGTLQQPELGQALAKSFGRECLVNFRVLGFTAKGAIALEAQPLSPEEEEVLGTLSCTRKKTYFEMDRSTETLVSVPDLPKLQHNAKVEAGQSK
jgi:hypothetical protein